MAARTEAVSPAASFAVATRVAGVTIAAAYLLGLLPGPVVSVVGGLALVTFGRALLLDSDAAQKSAVALAVFAGSVGVGSLRWGTLDLSELRGVQAVLGPSVLVGPPLAAIACIGALIAGLLALSVWVLEPRGTGRDDLVITGIETAAWALALVTVFFDPARSVLQGAGLGAAALDIALWLGAVIVAGGIAIGISLLLRDRGVLLRWIVLGTAGLLLLVAAAFVTGSV